MNHPAQQNLSPGGGGTISNVRIHVAPEGILLSSLPSSSSTGASPQISDEDLDPESDFALLRRHRASGADSDGDASSNLGETANKHFIAPLQKLLGLMSKASLLLRSAPGFGTGSYGGVPAGASTDNSAEEEDDVRRRDRRRGNKSGLRNTISSGTNRSSMHRSSESTLSRHVKRRRSSATRHIGQSSSSNVEDGGDLIDGVGLEGRYGVGAIPIPNSTVEGAHTKGERISSDNASEEAITEDDSLTDDDEDPPDNSPYPQVRASVSAVDNTSLSINTPRMWTLSMLFAILGSATNLFFSLRYPSVSITPVIALLLVHPLGLLWDRVLKRRNDPDEEIYRRREKQTLLS